MAETLPKITNPAGWLSSLLLAAEKEPNVDVETEMTEVLSGVRERPSATMAKSISDTEQTVVTEANNQLARDVAAENAVYVVMGQRGLDHPTLLSKWTMNEIARLLHTLYADPSATIKLGGQHLGAGFVKSE
jgi:hypothetical protein